MGVVVAGIQHLKARYQGNTIDGIRFRAAQADGTPIDLTGISAVVTWRVGKLTGPLSDWGPLTLGDGLTLTSSDDSEVPDVIEVDQATPGVDIPDLEVGNYYGDCRVTWPNGVRRTIRVFMLPITRDVNYDE